MSRCWPRLLKPAAAAVCFVVIAARCLLFAAADGHSGSGWGMLFAAAASAAVVVQLGAIRDARKGAVWQQRGAHDTLDSSRLCCGGSDSKLHCKI